MRLPVWGYVTLLWQPLAKYLYRDNLALAGPGEISLLLWLLVKGMTFPSGKKKQAA